MIKVLQESYISSIHQFINGKKFVFLFNGSYDVEFHQRIMWASGLKERPDGVIQFRGKSVK